MISIIGSGSGCGAVGRAVAYDTRGPGLKSSHRQLLFEHLFTVLCLTKIKKKRPGMAHFLVSSARIKINSVTRFGEIFPI